MIAMFSAGKHIPQETTHQTTLQGVVYQLDVALDDVQAQKSGIIFIYNMIGSKYNNFDYELSHKILNLLKGAYPGRLKKVLILSAPMWFKTPFRILQFFIRDKLRDRVHMINLSQLSLHITTELIPIDLGGTYQINHQQWLEHCLQIHKNDMGDLCPSLPSDKTLFPTPPSSNVSSLNSSPIGTMKNNTFSSTSSSSSSSSSSTILSSTLAKHSFMNNFLNNDNHSVNSNNNNNNSDITTTTTSFPSPLINGCNNMTTIQTIMNNNNVNYNNNNNNVDVDNGPSPIGQPNEIESFLEIYEEIDDDIEGITLEEFLQHLNQKKRKGMFDEYNEIKMTPPTGTFDTARNKANQQKNRYVDVLSYDHSRVRLPMIDNDPNSDYINANYVDGYRQKRAFISTQGN